MLETHSGAFLLSLTKQHDCGKSLCKLVVVVERVNVMWSDVFKNHFKTPSESSSNMLTHSSSLLSPTHLSLLGTMEPNVKSPVFLEVAWTVSHLYFALRLSKKTHVNVMNM